LNQALHESLALLSFSLGVLKAPSVVTNAIATLGQDCSAEALLLEAARSTFEHNLVSAELSSILPVELQTVSLLPSTSRYCFVLRVLMHFDLETCSDILRLSRDKIEEALYQSLLQVPQSGKTRVDSQSE
jgi:hypothetical protein